MKLKRLKTLRMRAGLTQVQLAEKADIAPATLRGYEKGKEAFLAKAQVIATALSVKLEELL